MRYYKRVDGDGNTITVESYSHDKEVEGAIEIPELEYSNYIEALPPPLPQPPERDLAAEIDELKAIYDADADGRIERDALEWAAGKLLRGAGEGVDPVLIDVPSVKLMATGTYTGNASGGRQITTGFKCNLIMIVNTTNYSYSGYILPGGSIALFSSPASGGGTLHGTNGFVLDGTHLNRNNHVYYYWAISE